jgi:uncharacterized protein (TIGR02246 family)
MTKETTTHIEEASVLDVLAKLYTAWADGDADAFAALYRDDATVVLPGVFNRGRDQIRKHMSAGFEGPLKGSRGIDEPQDIRIIDGHTAIVTSTAGILMAGETQLPAERERFATWILTQRDGSWLIAAYTNTPAH